MRNWKLGTYLATGLGTFHLVFRENYEQLNGREHVFSGIQRWYNTRIDDMLGIDVNKRGYEDRTFKEGKEGGGASREFENRTENVAAPASGVFKPTKKV